MFIDYTKYSLDELYDVRENIDKRVFPKRYEALIVEISCREKDLTNKLEEEPLSKKDKGLIVITLLGVASVFSVWTIINAIFNGFIRGKHGNEYSLATEPELYYLYIGLYVFIIFGFIYNIVNRLRFKSDT